MNKIFLTNFEIFKQANLTVDGLVALVGESNNGKTAAYNGIKVLTRNIQGTNYIRTENGKQVNTGCRVGWQFEDGNAVVFEKITSPIYSIKVGETKATFDKAGRGPTPVDVADLINMRTLSIDDVEVDLNFIDQLQEPLLKKTSDTVMYKMVVKSFDGEKIQEAIAYVDKDIKANKEEVKVKELAVETKKKEKLVLIERKENYIGIVPFFEQIEWYRVSVNRLEQIKQVKNTLDRLLQKIGQVDETLSKMEAVTPMYEASQRVKAKYEVVKDLEEYNGAIQRVGHNIKTISERLDTLQSADVLFKNSAVYLDKVYSLKYVLDWHNGLLDLETKINWREQGLQAINGLPNIETHSKNVQRKTYLVGLTGQYESLRKRVGELVTATSRYEAIPDTMVVREKVTNRQYLTINMNSIEVLKKQIGSSTEQLGMVDTEMVEVQYMIDNNICQTCGQACKCDESK